MKRIVLFGTVFGALILGAVYGLNVTAQTEYKGQDERQIKSLSKSDIEELRAGKGMGLAKAAELNGYPGPVHLLEFKEKIELTDEQTAEITALYAEMKNKAVPLGEELIKLEKKLDDQFAGKSVTEASLSNTLDEIERVKKSLRFVHLATHLRTPKILTKKQVEDYNRLRGYSSKDPCQNVPEGHDPAMWKKHNGCS
jgi:hypothetical protein